LEFAALDANTPLDEALRRIAEDVHLILNDHYSGGSVERDAAAHAYSRLTVIFERDVDGTKLSSTDEIIEAALDPVRFGLHPRADYGAEQSSTAERTQ
jgi:hypothetical protein